MDSISEIPLFLCYPHAAARAVDAGHVAVLAASIAEIGLTQPIKVRRVQKSRDGQMTDAFEVIAGMHRVKAFRKLGCETIPAIVCDVSDIIAELTLIDENLCRNDLSPAERASATSRRKALYEQLHPETAHGGDRKSSRQIGDLKDDDRFTADAAEKTGQSERTIQRDAARGEALGEGVLAKVARTSLDKGEELDALAKMEPQDREVLIDRAAKGEDVSAKIEVKKLTRAVREETLAKKQRDLPTKKFGVIVADPEWRFEPWSRETGMDRAADNHYPTSCTEVIASRPVATIAADDCVLFLWATAPMLPHALLVMAAWGFDYASNYVWDKVKVGTGYWNRNVHEHLLIGTKGNNLPAPAPGTQLNSIIEAKATKHSAKPEQFLEMIERYFPNLPKIELNARGAGRPGWEVWGNQAVTAASTDAPLTEHAAPATAASPETNLPDHDPDTGEVIEQVTA